MDYWAAVFAAPPTASRFPDYLADATFQPQKRKIHDDDIDTDDECSSDHGSFDMKAKRLARDLRNFSFADTVYVRRRACLLNRIPIRPARFADRSQSNAPQHNQLMQRYWSSASVSSASSPVPSDVWSSCSMPVIIS